MEAKIQKIQTMVKKELSCSAHSFDHIQRVYNLCLYLVHDEDNVDLEALKLAALLHDIARTKEDQDKTGQIDHALLGAEMAEKILQDLSLPKEKIEKIKHCIESHRYRNNHKPEILEAKILFDADKLDVLGAVGLARSFMIAGQYGEKIYSDKPIETYIKDNLVDGKALGRIKDVSKHAPNLEFETKFKHIPKRLFTAKAKKLARERLAFMKNFFERLHQEIKGRL